MQRATTIWQLSFSQMSKEREAFDKLSAEEKKQLAILGNMLAQPLDPEDVKMQELLDRWVDAKTKEEDK